MKKTGLNVMKKITIDFEQHSLEYFTYHGYNSNEFKTLLSITFPGYPSTFTIESLEKIKVCSQNESDINLNLSISIFNLGFQNFWGCCEKSVFFETDYFKKIKISEGINFLSTNISSENFSNPYSIFSFDNYMELFFKKPIKKNFFFQNENQIYNNNFKYLCSNSVNLFSKILYFIVLNENVFNEFKIFFIFLFFLRSLYLNSTSIIEIFLKLILNFLFVKIFRKLLKFNLIHSSISKKGFAFFEKNPYWEKEFTLFKTFWIGFIRSANFFTI
jgi:hypothetical protein